eukprot:6499422-Prymnesium_polylepis.1
MRVRKLKRAVGERCEGLYGSSAPQGSPRAPAALGTPSTVRARPRAALAHHHHWVHPLRFERAPGQPSRTTSTGYTLYGSSAPQGSPRAPRSSTSASMAAWMTASSESAAISAARVSDASFSRSAVRAAACARPCRA